MGMYNGKRCGERYEYIYGVHTNTYSYILTSHLPGGASTLDATWRGKEDEHAAFKVYGDPVLTCYACTG